MNPGHAFQLISDINRAFPGVSTDILRYQHDVDQYVAAEEAAADLIEESAPRRMPQRQPQPPRGKGKRRTAKKR